MDFTFNEDQLLLQQAARDFLQGECTPEWVRAGWESETGRDPAFWTRLAEIGLPCVIRPAFTMGGAPGEFGPEAMGAKASSSRASAKRSPKALVSSNPPVRRAVWNSKASPAKSGGSSST